MKVILILKRSDNIHSLLDVIQKNSPKAIFLCPVEYGCDGLIMEIENFCKRDGQMRCQKLDFISEFNKNAFRYKDDFIAFIGQLSSKKVTAKSNLTSYFKCPFHDFSLWWFSLISERSPSKTRSYSFFIRILTILDFRDRLKVDKIWSSVDPLMRILSRNNSSSVFLVNGDNLLRFFINDFKASLIEALKAFKFYCVLVKRTLDMKFFHLKNKKDAKIFDSKLFLVTAFPYLDADALEKGKFVNKIYGVLPESIELSGQKRFSWIGMFVNVEPHTWRDALRFVAKLKKLNIQFQLLEEYLSFLSIFRLMFYHLIVCFRFFKALPSYSILFNYQREDNTSLDLWPIFKNDFISSLVGKTFLNGLYYYFLFSSVTAHMKEKSEIIHFCEMQAWEKALQIAIKEKLKHDSIGLQHTIVPLMLLSYFNHPTETEGDNFISKKPLPDKLACVGEITRIFFLDNGWNKSNVFTLGAFRFHNFNRREKIQTYSRERDNQVVVAFSISPHTNREMLRLIHDAFNKKNYSFKVLLKSHPCDPLEKTIKKIGLKFDSDVFVITQQPLHKIVPISKAMIVKDSSSIFEALINNIPVIVPQLYDTIDLCPLSGVSDLPLYVKNANELFTVTDEIVRNNHSCKDEQSVQSFINSYLETFQNKSKYYENILIHH